MPKLPKTVHSLRKLRKIIGVTQPEFARLIGISASMIQGIELGKRKMNEGLAKRVFYATGVDPRSIMDEKSTPRIWFGLEYEYVQNPLELWKRTIKLSQSTLIQRIDQLSYLIEVAFKAASEIDDHRAFAVGHSFLDWLHATALDFGLMRRIERILKDEGSMRAPNPFLLLEKGHDPQRPWLSYDRPYKLDPELEAMNVCREHGLDEFRIRKILEPIAQSGSLEIRQAANRSKKLAQALHVLLSHRLTNFEA